MKPAWSRFACLGSLLALASCWPSAAPAQDAFSIRTNYYAVAGDSLRELRRSLDQARPRNGGDPRDGLTTWQVNWKVAISRYGQVNRLGTFTTRTAITMTLPRWPTPTNAAPEVVAGWQDYWTALHTHEQGHVQLVRATVAEMHARVRALPSGNDGEALRQQAEAVARSILANGAQRHQEYDQRTRHGETQGARLESAPRPHR